MPKTKKKVQNKLKPWPDCRFEMKIGKEKYPTHLILTVYLERRSKGKYGRLELAKFFIPPKRKRKSKDDLFDRLFSFDFRNKTYRKILEKMNAVGVPAKLQEAYINALSEECPIPTKEELYLEEIEHPVMKLILGDDIKKLSYFKTGIPEITNEDDKFIKQKTKAFDYKDKKNSKDFMKIVFGRDISL